MEGCGKWTGAALNDLTPLSMPWEKENGQYRPPFRQDAARLSLELAASAYDLNMDAWRQAGWTDFSYQVDNTLLTGENVGGGRVLGSAVSEYLQRLARARVNRSNPVSQLRGALRQRESSDTCKAVVMIHSLPAGQYLVAIGFMGTGKRIYDWFSNFRMQPEEGAHAGFWQLAKEFQERCGDILFPETARALGVTRLSLRDILTEGRRLDSRFRIWMAGHSQGGAVMQLFALREIQSGFLRRNMLGYGFASPRALYERPDMDPADFPLHHIFNGDDVTPRVGALLHTGACHVFRTDDLLRARCYGDLAGNGDFRAALTLVDSVRNTKDGLVWLAALLAALEKLEDAEMAASLAGMLGRVLPGRVQGLLDGRVDDLLRALRAWVEKQYGALSDSAALPGEKCRLMQERMERLMTRCGPRQGVRLLSKAMSLPHRLRNRDGQDPALGSYQYIVNERFDEVLPGADALPVRRRYAERRPAAGRYARFSDSRVKRQRTVSQRRT